MSERLFTPDEANALVPRLRPLLGALREAYHEHRFAREQWEELERFGGDEAERVVWRERAERTREEVARVLAEVEALGAEVKDPLLGLADFRARRGDGSVALLCYRDDEARIGYWHPADAGFSARRPIEEL